MTHRDKSNNDAIPLGFEVGTGEPVNIPRGHTFVTGQTQLSGKTTTLLAIVARSNRNALAFITKRGEKMDGRRIRPFLPREGERPIHWRFVESIMASALGQKDMRFDRWFILNAAKGAKSLADVRINVGRLREKAKGETQNRYELIGEYLDLVLPEMRALNASHTLELNPGLSVIDISGHSLQLQAMVIRAALEQINQHEKGVLTVFPEAWEFCPRDRMTPAKSEAIAMARKGAVLGNLLLSDSQDIAGVDTVLRQAASVWLLGVQREANELKRSLAVVKSTGTAVPKPRDMATLSVGQFFACWGSNAIKTYVRPDGMSEADARGVAMGELRVSEPIVVDDPGEPEDIEIPQSLIEEDDMASEEIRELSGKFDQLIAVLGNGRHSAASTPTAEPSAPAGDEEAMFRRFRDRLIKDPAVLKVLVTAPEIDMEVTRRTVSAIEDTLFGRIVKLLSRDWFDGGKTNSAVRAELKRTGPDANSGNIARELNKLISLGFLTNESSGFTAVPGMKVNITKK